MDDAVTARIEEAKAKAEQAKIERLKLEAEESERRTRLDQAERETHRKEREDRQKQDEALLKKVEIARAADPRLKRHAVLVFIGSYLMLAMLFVWHMYAALSVGLTCLASEDHPLR